MYAMEKYYLLDGNNVIGPYTVEQLQQKSLKVNSLICQEGTEEWKKISEISELSILKQSLPAPAPPKINQKKAMIADSIKIVFSSSSFFKLFISIMGSIIIGAFVGTVYFYNSDGAIHLEQYTEYTQKIKNNSEIAEMQNEYWRNVTDGKTHPASWEQSANAYKNLYLPFKQRAWYYGIIVFIVVFTLQIGYRVFKLSTNWINENATI